MLAIVSSAIGGLLIGLEMETGLRIGLTAMAGDIMSSFLKRRLRMAPSAKAPGLDQVPESLLPFLAVKNLLGLSAWDILVGVGAFWVGELVISGLLYALHIRDRPY